jgi:hypothetical protein
MIIPATALCNWSLGPSPQTLNPRSMSPLIVTPAIAAAMPIVTVSVIVPIGPRLAIRALATARTISGAVVTRISGQDRDRPILYSKNDGTG